MSPPRTPSVTRVSAFSSRKTIKVATPRPRQSSITRHRLVDREALADAAQQAGASVLDAGSKATTAGLTKGLRFLQFLRAYMKAFAAGMAAYLLVSELGAGHFNIFAMIGMHIFSIIAAPFYALMLAPAIFGLYNILAATMLPQRWRAYAVGCMLGIVMLAPRITSGRFILDGKYAEDALAIGIMLSGALAAYVFNRDVDRITADQA